MSVFFFFGSANSADCSYICSVLKAFQQRHLTFDLVMSTYVLIPSLGQVPEKPAAELSQEMAAGDPWVPLPRQVRLVVMSSPTSDSFFSLGKDSSFSIQGSRTAGSLEEWGHAVSSFHFVVLIPQIGDFAGIQCIPGS